MTLAKTTPPPQGPAAWRNQILQRTELDKLYPRARRPMSIIGSDMQASTAILGCAEPFLRGLGAAEDSSSGVGGFALLLLI